MSTASSVQARELKPALKSWIGRKTRVDTQISAFINDTFHGALTEDDFFWINTIQPEQLRPCNPDHSGYANVERLNDIRTINKFLETANQHLQKGKYILVCAETVGSRRKRILAKFPKPFNYLYYFLDFILKRVMPKTRLTHKIYYAITKGRNRVLSRTETLGRLHSCGFKVLNHRLIGHKTWFIAKKVTDPLFDMEPTYGVLVTLKRVGYKGELINVSKIRTMHPFSEYIQDYIYEKNDLQNGGKINNDFRITSWGRVLRKLWIDELPMIWNALKGEMKLVGVRPLSRHYFSLYSDEMKELRTSVKPGLVPPFYVDMPETFEEIMESERAYIEAYKEKPIRTDIHYFCKAFYNILIKRARSA
ncbi:sugar transferase [Rhodohalobacter sp. SW132]|uniref:sugar transferase n=1 Tax=Rhodohalobacter sp. SW132 TaxID=2293433 RepID=UPI000E248E93|nr:sugar transferase [Rhodohalobacter sp. SW132]REL33812.1 sugar transferase [Rhodohalobacter sp. SW132]